jgi:hypothetical protein
LLDYWHVGAIVLYLKQTFEADRVGEKSIEALLLLTIARRQEANGEKMKANTTGASRLSKWLITFSIDLTILVAFLRGHE